MRPFEEVVREHGETVFRVCRAILPPHDAEDAWSETFLAALRAYPGLGEGANVQAWLVTIAHRKAIDIIRRREREMPSEPGHAEPRNKDEESDGQVWELVRELAPKQRQVIAYRYQGGLSYADIAALVGGTPEAARRAGADALKRLRARSEELR